MGGWFLLGRAPPEKASELADAPDCREWARTHAYPGSIPTTALCGACSSPYPTPRKVAWKCLSCTPTHLPCQGPTSLSGDCSPKWGLGPGIVLVVYFATYISLEIIPSSTARDGPCMTYLSLEQSERPPKVLDSAWPFMDGPTPLGTLQKGTQLCSTGAIPTPDASRPNCQDIKV
jgi:hypothetical protein